VQGVFSWAGGRPEPCKPTTLYYSRDSSELRHKSQLVAHVGCNGWDSPPADVALARVERKEAEAAGLGNGDWRVPAFHALMLPFNCMSSSS
jgi:hypothetical protein